MQLVFWKFLQLFCMSVSFLGGMTMAETMQILAQLPLNLEFSDYAGKDMQVKKR